MTVKDLRKLLEGVDENTPVIVPMNAAEGFDGVFFSPCIEESGLGEMGTEFIEEEDLKEMELLNKEIPKESSFILVPCGFFEEKDHTHELN